MAVTPEAISLVLLLRTIWLITMPKALFIPYDKRPKEHADADGAGRDGVNGGDNMTLKETRLTA